MSIVVLALECLICACASFTSAPAILSPRPNGLDRGRDCANGDRLRFLSKDTGAEQGVKKVVHKFQRWIRLSANDRPKPARC